MAPEELDVALDELETRLERLRALYDQYFLGIEKIEPSVQRKDVDRRIWLMRREQIRNTARRFKLQTLVQRYNTFQQYWARVCRDIENGTYARHLIRAEKVLGDMAPLTIAARKRQGMFRRGEEKRADREKARGDQPSEPPAPAEAEPSPESAATPLAHAIIAIGDPARSPARPNAPNPPGEPPPKRPGPAPPPPRAAALAAPMGAPPAPPRAPPRTEPLAQLDLDMDFLSGAKPPGASPTTSSPGARPPPIPPRTKPPPAVAPAPPAQPPPGPPAPGREPRPPLARAGVPPPRAAPTATAPSEVKGAVSEQRVREIHSRLVDAKRQCNEPPEVNVEVLGRSLRAVASRLRERHGDRSVDFDVVIKDGKAVIKPILR